jgi:hypothetical protein
MHIVLAYAQAQDSSDMSLVMVFAAALILAATAAAAYVLIHIARRRRHPRTDLIGAAAFFWALLTAASLLYAEQSQMNWSKEYNVRLESGYFDPTDTTDAPKLPWKTWTGLGIAYTAMLTWALSQKRTAPPAP